MNIVQSMFKARKRIEVSGHIDVEHILLLRASLDILV